jgi:predicted phage terminase large subunit-like protein
MSFFVKMAWAALHPGEALEWSHHHDALCDHVQWMLEGWMCKKADPSYVQPCRQMVVSLPPTTLKTELLMVFAPAWMWVRWPAWRVLCLSCNPRVALDSAVASRRVIESPWYRQTFQPDWKLLDDQNAKSDFGTTAGGKRQSHGMSAAVVGEHADCVRGDTLVATEVGSIRIDALHAMDRPPRVWSTREDGTLELREITATRRVRERQTVTVRVDSHHVVHCTRDHRFWTDGSYEPADKIAGRRVSILRYPDEVVSREAYALPPVHLGEPGVRDLRAPFHSTCDRAPPREPDHALLEVPHETPQVEEATVQSVDDTAVSGGSAPVDVYDIQVEGNHNFFANGVLVHNCILVDDPTDPKEASRAALDKANRDWPGLRNRVTDERSSIRIIVQQRLDVDDLSGFVTRGAKGRAWVRVVLPMEFVPAKRCETPMPVNASNRLALDGERAVGSWADWRTFEGELIQPSRYPADILEELRLNAGPYGWSSQYQQDPVPRDGGRVKRSWLNYFRLAEHHAGDHRRPDGTGIDREGNPSPALVVPRLRDGRWDLDWVYLSVDPASKKTDAGSLWGLLAVAGKGARRLVLDDRSRRGEPDEILQDIRDMVAEWRPARLLIEDTAAGPTLIRTLTEELGAGKIRGSDGRPVVCKVQALSPAEVGGDKEARLAGVINQLAAGLVYLLEGASWLADFVDELAMFPNWPTADRVDALTALLAITRAEDSLWPEVRAERARAEGGFPTTPAPSMLAKLNAVWLGVPIPKSSVGSTAPSEPAPCQHEWIDGKCRVCGAAG